MGNKFSVVIPLDLREEVQDHLSNAPYGISTLVTAALTEYLTKDQLRMSREDIVWFLENKLDMLVTKAPGTSGDLVLDGDTRMNLYEAQDHVIASLIMDLKDQREEAE